MKIVLKTTYLTQNRLGKFLAVILFTMISLSNGYGTRNDIHKMMYLSIDNPTSCFRRLNGTHQFGCSSSRSGSFGVIHLLNNRSDVNWLIEKAPAGPYVVALTPALFNNDIMNSLNSLDAVSGVLLIVNPNEDPPEHYSPDDVCPNRYSSEENCNSQRTWNPSGNFFLFENWQVPIFTISNPVVIKKILDCNNIFNFPLDTQRSRSLCSLHMKAHMFAATNSHICMRRSSLVSFSPMRFCDPLGDQNIFLSLGSPEWKENNVIVVAARLDSASMFDNIAPGAMGSVTGIVTLLTTAHILYSAISSLNGTQKSFVFLLLNGEGFDYIGSSKIVFDMSKKKFPAHNLSLNIEDFEFFIDISQLDQDSKLYLHYHQSSKAEEFSEKLKKYGEKSGIEFHNVQSENLPPSSLHTFHKAKPNLPGLVMTNFREEFTNKYYHGLFDTGRNLNFSYKNGSSIENNSLQFRLASIADSLARALYTYASSKEMPHHDSKEHLIDEMLHCYLENSRCKLMQTLIGRDTDMSEPPLSLYVGVAGAPNRITWLTGILLASLTSPRAHLNEEECVDSSEANKIFSFMWVHNDSGLGECINTTLKFTPASSPAFEIDDYNWTSGEYSTWTESVWQEITLQMFIKPSRTHELVTLVSGLITFLMSSIVVYFLSARGQRIFMKQCSGNCQKPDANVISLTTVIGEANNI